MLETSLSFFIMHEVRLAGDCFYGVIVWGIHISFDHHHNIIDTYSYQLGTERRNQQTIYIGEEIIIIIIVLTERKKSDADFTDPFPDRSGRLEDSHQRPSCMISSPAP